MGWDARHAEALNVLAQQAFPLGAGLGEGPVWVERDQSLWLVDIEGCRVHRLHPATGTQDTWSMPVAPGFLAPCSTGGFAVGLKGALQRFDPVRGTLRLLAPVEADQPANRINDGCVSPEGALWFGTMHEPESLPSGGLYRLDPQGHCVSLDRGYTVSNGPAFSPDGRTFYHTDSVTRTVYAFDREEPHVLTRKRELLRIEAAAGYPDGTTVDAEGCLWIGLWSGWAVRRYSPEGELLATVNLPCALVTKVAFGGADLRTAYVTTARRGLSAGELAAQPLAGDVFSFNAPVPGMAQRYAVLACD